MTWRVIRLATNNRLSWLPGRAFPKDARPLPEHTPADRLKLDSRRLHQDSFSRHWKKCDLDVCSRRGSIFLWIADPMDNPGTRLTPGTKQPSEADAQTRKLREKIRQIYSIAAELEEMFPGRKFTPDGNMVGSIGEAIAAFEYGVELFALCTPGIDGAANGRNVQIKATQGREVALKKPKSGDLLLVIRINSEGSWEKVYDGDLERAWNALETQKETYMREKTISLKRLRELQAWVEQKDRILPRTPVI